MSKKYLFGPVTPEFADEYLSRVRRSGECLAFDESRTTDLTVKPTDTWAEVVRRLPQGWRPDFVVVNVSYTRLPLELWWTPVPLVAFAPDWNLQWHAYRTWLRRCELILTDTAGVRAMKAAGIAHARAGNLFGLSRLWLELANPEVPRDIDILFVGNLHPEVQRERLPWLRRLAALADRYRVVISTGVFGPAYRRLLARTRIVFNRSLRGECNMRAFETAMAGALLFQETANLEIRDYFEDGRECILYDSENLEQRLEHYLGHEDERATIARAGSEKVRQFGFEDLWARALAGTVEKEWNELVERANKRPRPGRDELRARTWQAMSSQTGPDLHLLDHLAAALRTRPAVAELANCRGLTVLLAHAGGRPYPPVVLTRAAECFEHAVAADAGYWVAGLNLAETLLHLGRRDETPARVRQTLAAMNDDAESDRSWVEGVPFPPGFDVVRVEWEKAAWTAADRAEEVRIKTGLLRWRLHLLLGELTGDLQAYRAAVRERPDLPVSQAALGLALGRAGLFAEAVGPLRTALETNPFDAAAARALAESLARVGDREGTENLARQRRLLSRAVAQAVPPESELAAAGTQGRRLVVDTLRPDEFHRRFGDPDTSRALSGYTPPGDTHLVLSLLAYARPRRVLEVGTALGHMTANLTEWTDDDARVYTIGVTDELGAASRPEQRSEVPSRADFGRFVNHFGKAAKVFSAMADSRHYDFGRLAPLDFAFIDGAHDLDHVLSDSQEAYAILAEGGWLVWHDFDSPVPWVEVRLALERLGFAEPVYHVAGSGVAFMRKGGNLGEPVGAGSASEGRRVRVPCPRLCVGMADHAPANDALMPTQSRGHGTHPCSEPLTKRSRGIVWEGPHGEVQSLALVNAELCRRLAARGHDVVPVPTGHGLSAAQLREREGQVVQAFLRTWGRPYDVTVAHQWPPRFDLPPFRGHWVVFQHWEFGSLPKIWIEPMTERVDEVWVGSTWVKECFEKSGIPADQVHVIPLGVDPEAFRPGVPPLALATGKRFKFLFVGGTIHRKGIDVLLRAYAEEFTRSDDVCLVVKDMGGGTVYRGQTAQDEIGRLRSDPDAPEMEYLDRTLAAEELAGLYAACDCLVHPYRGEGFGLPIAEAMACGLPVIVTGYGAALDFCNDENAYLVPANLVYFPERKVDVLETVDHPWLAEPDVAAVRAAMRRVLENPEEAKAKGKTGRERILAGFTWDRTADAVECRLEALRRRPIRRTGFLTRPVPQDGLGNPSYESAGRPALSICLIVKNEEKNLPDCLASAAGLGAEIVVLDTGSTDNTKEVARRFGAKVFDFPWCDDFSAARNECLKHATGRWIFWLDADDRLDEENRKKLAALAAGLHEPAAFSMKCRCLPDPETGTATVVDHIRLFPNLPGLRWRYRVHEQILPGLRELGVPVYEADIVVQHTGYLDAALRAKKSERDLRLLRLDVADHPNEPFINFNIGWSLVEQGRHAEALAYLKTSLEHSHPSDSIVRKLFSLIVESLRRLGRTADAWAVCQEGRGLFPDDEQLLDQEGVLRQETGDPAGAEAAWKKLRNGAEAPHFASVAEGLRTFRAAHRLGLLYLEQGREAEAEQEWSQARQQAPGFLPAALGLGELYLRRGRWADLECLCRELMDNGSGPGASLEGAALRARGHLARREYGAAVCLLKELTAAAPRAVLPRILLSHALLQEGRDWPAAEGALLAVLELEPGNAEARNNLAVLRRQHPPGETGPAV